MVVIDDQRKMKKPELHPATSFFEYFYKSFVIISVQEYWALIITAVDHMIDAAGSIYDPCNAHICTLYLLVREVIPLRNNQRKSFIHRFPKKGLSPLS